MVTEVGSYLRLTDSCITELKDQGPSRTCNESKEDDGSKDALARAGAGIALLQVYLFLFFFSTLAPRVE